MDYPLPIVVYDETTGLFSLPPHSTRLFMSTDPSFKSAIPIATLGSSVKLRVKLLKKLLACSDTSGYTSDSPAGLYFWGTVPLRDSSGHHSQILVIDAFTDTLNNNTPDWSVVRAKLWSIAVLLSSTTIFLHEGAIKPATFEQWSFLPSVLDDLAFDMSGTTAKTSVTQSESSPLKCYLPHFVWLLESVHLGTTEWGAIQEYLRRTVSCEHSEGVGHDVHHRVKRAFTHFPAQTCVIRHENDTDTFALKKTLERTVSVKTINGMEGTADTLLTVAGSLLEQLNHSITPDLTTAWVEVAKEKCLPFVEEAMEMYRSLVRDAVTQGPIMSLQTFEEQHHQQGKSIAVEMFEGNCRVSGQEKSMAKKRLKQAIQAEAEKYRAVLMSRSQDSCQRLRRDVVERLREHLSNGHVKTLDDFILNIKKMINQYQDIARGPQANAVLLALTCEDLIELFKVFEETGFRELSNEQIKAEIEKQKEIWEQKRLELVEQLRNEHDRLKASVNHERETFRRLSGVTQNRLKVGDGEIRALRKEVEDYKAHLSEQQRARQDAEDRLAESTRKLNEINARFLTLQSALESEKQLCVGLESKIDQVLKEAEQREEGLHADFHRLKESASRREDLLQAEVCNMTASLKQLTEEKTILQTKLGDMLMKASALPIQMQRHFFLAEEQDFADALAVYVDQTFE